MSLDVYLERPEAPTRSRDSYRTHELVERIFIRRGGHTVEITREEWDELYPGYEPVVARVPVNELELFHANITHNLGEMADAVDLYEPLWRPDEIGITHARQLIEPLEIGLARLHSERDRLQAFNPVNGWGDYDGLVEFTSKYLIACRSFPDAEVRVWR